MCGAEALLIAVTLATQLVRSEPDTALGSMIFNAGCAQCRCVHGSFYYACMAEHLAEEEKRISDHNAKVKEFQQITRMCGIGGKP